ncbi:hypothetical protein Tco_0696233 [Tanacetum coccineum]
MGRSRIWVWDRYFIIPLQRCYTKAHSCDNSGIKEAIVSRESDNWNDRKDKSVDPSKELRLHWDLYTMMDELGGTVIVLRIAASSVHRNQVVYYSTLVASSSLFNDDDNYDEDEEEEPRKELQTTTTAKLMMVKVVVRDLVDNESNLKGEPQSIWLHQLKGQMTSILYMLIMHIIDMKTFILSRSQLGLRTIRLRPHCGESENLASQNIGDDHDNVKMRHEEKVIKILADDDGIRSKNMYNSCSFDP